MKTITKIYMQIFIPLIVVIIIIGIAIAQTVKECEEIDLKPCSPDHLECYRDCNKLNLEYWKVRGGYGDDSCICLKNGESKTIW